MNNDGIVVGYLPLWFKKSYLPVVSGDGKLEWFWAVDQQVTTDEAEELRRFVKTRLK